MASGPCARKEKRIKDQRTRRDEEKSNVQDMRCSANKYPRGDAPNTNHPRIRSLSRNFPGIPHTARAQQEQPPQAEASVPQSPSVVRARLSGGCTRARGPEGEVVLPEPRISALFARRTFRAVLTSPRCACAV